jgi:cytochrome c
MSSFEWNKIIASVLTAMIVAMVTGILASEIVRPKHLEHPVYVPPGAEGGATAAATPAGGAQEATAKVEPIEPVMAKADPKHGEQVAKVCLQCHSFEKGGPNKIGPNLFGVVGEDIAKGAGGYAFSDALKSKQGKWDVDSLNAWLWKPQSFAKGTKMTFAGLPKAKDRADIVAYLESLK